MNLYNLKLAIRALLFADQANLRNAHVLPFAVEAGKEPSKQLMMDNSVMCFDAAILASNLMDEARQYVTVESVPSDATEQEIRETQDLYLKGVRRDDIFIAEEDENHAHIVREW